MLVLILSTAFSEIFLILRRINITVYRCKVKYPLVLQYFNQIPIFSKDFRKHSNVKFHRFPSSGSRVIPCGQTDMAKLILAFRNLTNAPTKGNK